MGKISYPEQKLSSNGKNAAFLTINIIQPIVAETTGSEYADIQTALEQARSHVPSASVLLICMRLIVTGRPVQSYALQVLLTLTEYLPIEYFTTSPFLTRAPEFFRKDIRSCRGFFASDGSMFP
jgi:hypothetical protein